MEARGPGVLLNMRGGRADLGIGFLTFAMLALGLAACSTRSSNSTTGSAAEASAVSATPAVPATPATRASPPVVAACREGDLSIGNPDGQVGGMGGATVAIVFTNTGKQSCSLTGWPTITTPGLATKVLYQTTTGAGFVVPVATVILLPGQKGSSALDLFAAPGDTYGSCGRPGSWGVTPPVQVSPLRWRGRRARDRAATARCWSRPSTWARCPRSDSVPSTPRACPSWARSAARRVRWPLGHRQWLRRGTVHSSQGPWRSALVERSISPTTP